MSTGQPQPTVSFDVPDNAPGLKRKASSTLSAIMERLSSRNLQLDGSFSFSSSGQPGTPFQTPGKKLARFFGLAEESEPGAQAAAAAGGDGELRLSNMSALGQEELDELAKSLPGEEPLLRQMTTLDLTGELDLLELEKICAASEAGSGAALAQPAPGAQKERLQSTNLLSGASTWWSSWGTSMQVDSAPAQPMPPPVMPPPSPAEFQSHQNKHPSGCSAPAWKSAIV